MNCRICGKESIKEFEHLVLNKYMVGYYRCKECLFMQTEEPFWLKESYTNPINATDTGYVTRNIYLAKKALTLFFYQFRAKGIYIDYAGGYGILTRLMRDYGLDYYLDDLYTPNIFAKGFEKPSNANFTAATCFECFEHFKDPLEEIEKMIKENKTLFFSTKILPVETPPLDWEYYSFGHGQHISFYSNKTLKYISSKFSLNYYSNGENLHLFTSRKLSPYTFSLLMELARLPIDIIIKRLFLKTKMIEDQDILRKKGFN